MKHDSLGDNRKCFKGIFDKSYMKPDPSNVVQCMQYLLNMFQ